MILKSRSVMKINSKIKERSLKICLYIRNQLKLYKKIVV